MDRSFTPVIDVVSKRRKPLKSSFIQRQVQIHRSRLPVQSHESWGRGNAGSHKQEGKEYRYTGNGHDGRHPLQSNYYRCKGFRRQQEAYESNHRHQHKEDQQQCVL